MSRSRFAFASLSLLLASSLHAQNLLNNGGFVGGTLTPWIPGATNVYWSSLSATADGSGSAEMVLVLPSNVTSAIANGITQCVSGLTPGVSYAFGAKVLIPSGQPAAGGYADVDVQWYSGPNCTGSFITQEASIAVNSTNSPPDTWLPTRAALVAPAGTTSAYVIGGIGSRVSGGAFRLNMDDVYFQVAACQPSASGLCLDDFPLDGRFAVFTHYSTAQSGGLSGNGQAISLAPISIGQGGLFWFFDPSNPEMLAKVLNGCATNGNFWVFLTAGTNVGLTTTVRDSLTGRTKLYNNADLHPAAPVQDTTAFACVGGDSTAGPSALGTRTATECFSGPPVRRAATAAGCTTDTTALCIADRFKVQTSYHTSQGGGLSGAACPLGLTQFHVDAGGLFYFFDYGNPEMLLKVLDGCSVNGKFWVFYSATTNVGFTVTVTDTATGRQKLYTNADLHPATAEQDTQAFSCP